MHCNRDSQSVKRFLDQRNEGISFEGCIITVEGGNAGRFREGRLAWFPRNHIPYEAAESVLHQTLKCGETKLLCLRADLWSHRGQAGPGI